ncbi:hypothetical protein SEA_SCHWARTZ33_78 [Gordonia phage Schwartz33]|nr:hypothetical protein SEA_SCHWARTZ33_78 [Gordonia phage Schwartz33]
MQYDCVIVDEKVQLVIFQGCANSTGLNAFLDRFTDLNQKEKDAFMGKLIDTGSSEHIGNRDDDKSYSISAIRRVDYPLDQRINLPKGEKPWLREGRA